MAVIALSGSSLNYSMGLGAFDTLNTALTGAMQSSTALHAALRTLQFKISIASVFTSVGTSQELVQKAEARESEKQSALSVVYEKLDKLIIDTGVVDQKVANVISSREDEFYKRYYYLKPECKKSFAEKIANWCAEVVGNVIEWCKKNWDLIISGILVFCSLALLASGVGGPLTHYFSILILHGASRGAIEWLLDGDRTGEWTFGKRTFKGIIDEFQKFFGGERAMWKLGASILRKSYPLTAELLNMAADGKKADYFIKDSGYTVDLCKQDAGIRNHIIEQIRRGDTVTISDDGHHIEAKFGYPIPLGNGDLGAALHNVTIEIIGEVADDGIHARVIIEDTFDFTEYKNPFIQGGFMEGLLWFANDFAYFDTKDGILAPIHVKIEYDDVFDVLPEALNETD